MGETGGHEQECGDGKSGGGADGGLAVIRHGPVAGGAADGIEEAAQNFAALKALVRLP